MIESGHSGNEDSDKSQDELGKPMGLAPETLRLNQLRAHHFDLNICSSMSKKV